MNLDEGKNMQLQFSTIILIGLLAHNYLIAAPAAIQSISLKAGETQLIELPSNPTTGYSWYPTKKIENNPIISLVKSGYEANNTALIGSGGTQFWEIKGKKPGSYTLTLQYKRPWEKKVKPIEIKKFVITVKNQ